MGLKLMDKKADTVGIVESFIQRVHDLEYVIDPRATTILYRPGSESNLGAAISGHLRSLTDNLADAIHDYQTSRDNPALRETKARVCLQWIEKAFVSGVIKEGEGLAGKLKACQERNKEIEREKADVEQQKAKVEADLQKVSADYLTLEGQYRELEKRLRQMGIRNGEIEQ